MLTGTAGVRRPPPPGAIFGLTTIVVTLVLNRHGSRRVTIALGLLSIAVSTRYLYWRATETLHFRSPIEAAFGAGSLPGRALRLGHPGAERRDLVRRIGPLRAGWNQVGAKPKA